MRVFWFRRKCVGSRVDAEVLSGLFNFAFIVASVVSFFLSTWVQAAVWLGSVASARRQSVGLGSCWTWEMLGMARECTVSSNRAPKCRNGMI